MSQEILWVVFLMKKYAETEKSSVLNIHLKQLARGLIVVIKVKQVGYYSCENQI